MDGTTYTNPQTTDPDIRTWGISRSSKASGNKIIPPCPGPIVFTIPITSSVPVDVVGVAITIDNPGDPSFEQKSVLVYATSNPQPYTGTLTDGVWTVTVDISKTAVCKFFVSIAVRDVNGNVVSNAPDPGQALMQEC